MRMMMIRRIGEVSRRSYSTGRDFSTLPSVESGGGLWNSFAMGCRVLLTCSACAAGYASGDYITPIDNKELRDNVKEKECDLQALEQVLEFVHEVEHMMEAEQEQLGSGRGT